ncbi:MAG: dioxygenase [Planctomycetes bacterium]|nr:dioxygenase [Planctomycetota bacterium]
MRELPTLFISHGAPTLAIDDGPTARFLRELGTMLPRPRAILCASAHWATSAPQASDAIDPETIHDFSGFGGVLDEFTYPAPGDPVLAQRAVDLLRAAGFAGAATAARGFDHGAWVPLSLMYPDAEVAVVQVSLQPRLGPAHHLALGRALRPLRDEGVLVIGSGSASHNLGELAGGSAQPPGWMTAFDDWLTAAVGEGREADLIAYRALAPHAERNHPSDEHLLPLFVAMGAGDGGPGRLVHAAVTFGVLSMACFAFAGDR